MGVRIGLVVGIGVERMRSRVFVYITLLSSTFITV